MLSAPHLVNWQSIEAYPPIDAPGSVWAWEFLRRNKEYQFFWKEKCDPYAQNPDCLSLTGSLPGLGRNALGEFWPYLDESTKRFSVVDPCNPRESTPPNFFPMEPRYIQHINAGRRSIKKAPVDQQKLWEEYRKSQINSDGSCTWSVNLGEAEAAFVIDLSRPLAKQLGSIARIAEELQAAHGDIKRPKDNRKNYLLYLRILDAIDAGQKAMIIRDALFPDIPDEYPDSPRKDAYKKARRAATKMRDGGYRKLVV